MSYTCPKNSNNIKKMEANKFKSLLSELLGDCKIVKNVSVTNLLPPGENYMSTILRIQAKIQKTASADSKEGKKGKRVTKEEEEELHLIAKVPAAADDFQNIVPLDYVFQKEIFFYEEIFPGYRQLLDDTVLKCDIMARYYGSRIDPKEDKDFNGCILLENLKSSGYYTGDRQKGLDLEHSKFAIAKLAIFHASGVAMKHLKPAAFKGFREFCTNRFPGNTQEFDTMLEEIFERLREDNILQRYVPEIVKDVKPFQEFYTKVPKEPWVTIIHMDFWINNIMFHRHKDTVDDVKFVDFQTYGLGSPMRDLIHFIFTSVNFERVPMKTIDQLIDFYYEHFVKSLKVLLNSENSNFSEFSRHQFNKQIAVDASFELMPIIVANKFILMDLQEIDGDKNDRMTLVLAQPNSTFIDKMRKVILYFDKKQWI